MKGGGYSLIGGLGQPARFYIGGLAIPGYLAGYATIRAEIQQYGCRTMGRMKRMETKDHEHFNDKREKLDNYRVLPTSLNQPCD